MSTIRNASQSCCQCKESLDITGLTGITAAQRTALLALGAIEHQAPGGEPAAELSLEPAG